MNCYKTLSRRDKVFIVAVAMYLLFLFGLVYLETVK